MGDDCAVRGWRNLSCQGRSVVTAITAVIGFDTLYNIVYVVFFPT